jgi:hypothetical protein
VRRLACGATGVLLAVLHGDLCAQLHLSVQWQLPRDGLAFGDTLELEVVRRWPVDAVPEPFDAAALAPLLVSLTAVEPLDAHGERRHYRAAVCAAGTVVVPPLVLRARLRDGSVAETRHSPPPLQVRSLLAEPAGDVEWLQVFAARSRGHVLPWLLGAAVLLLGGLWWQRGRTWVHVGAAPAPPPPPDHLAALRELIVPPEQAPPAAVLAFCVRLAALVRDHAGRRLPVPVATRTSEEVVASAAAGVGWLRACLQHCDAVKFAAALPTAAAHAAARQAAIEFVQADPA